MGLYDAYEVYLYKCIGEDVKASSLKDAVAIYLTNNPRYREYPMRFVFLLAVNSHWECGLTKEQIIDLIS
jgi:hypothetical protein